MIVHYFEHSPRRMSCRNAPHRTLISSDHFSDYHLSPHSAPSPLVLARLPDKGSPHPLFSPRCQRSGLQVRATMRLPRLPFARCAPLLTSLSAQDLRPGGCPTSSLSLSQGVTLRGLAKSPSLRSSGKASFPSSTPSSTWKIRGGDGKYMGSVEGDPGQRAPDAAQVDPASIHTKHVVMEDRPGIV